VATEPKRYIRPTDDELRTRDLKIDDPHDQPNLVNHIPKGVEPVRILNVYSYSKYPGDKAYCAKCDAKRHRDGFTVELDDGSSALLGSKCGAKIWGETWKEVADRFKDEFERAGTIIGFGRLVPELRSIITDLELWRPMIKTVAKNQRRFEAIMGDTFQSLRLSAMRSDHALIVHDQMGITPQRAHSSLDTGKRRITRYTPRLNEQCIASKAVRSSNTTTLRLFTILLWKIWKWPSVRD
jgi:hypothetical protein